MLAHHDLTGSSGERSTERMSFRAKPHTKEMTQKAAALAGVNDSTFVMNAALEPIVGHESTVLQPIDHEAFFNALDREADPKSRSRGAFKHHSWTIVTK